MNLRVIAIAFAALQAVNGVPMSDRIFMPGDFPIILDINDGSAGDTTYNSDPSTHNTIRLVDTPPVDPASSSLVRKVDGKDCGIPHGTIVFNDTCQRLLIQGLCSEGEWLVKKETNNTEGECVPRPCPQGQLSLGGTCYNITDKKACSPGQMLYVDLTGHVHCDCEPNYFYDPWQGQCFTQHDRGTCNFGQYIEVTEGGNIKCVSNPCEMDNFMKHQTNGKCYHKQFRGTCNHPYVMKYHHAIRTVECIASSTHSIFDLPTLRSCPEGSRRFYNRNCRELYRIPTENVYPAAYGSCHTGFIKDPNGNCRKTHRLFG